MSAILQMLANTLPVGSPAPPIPPSSNSELIVSTFNWNNGGYPEGNAFTFEGGDISQTQFTGIPPYANNWDLSSDPYLIADPPPFLINTWYDQLSANDLIQAGAARPVLDATNQLVSFDGSTQGLVGSVPLYSGSTAGTIYIAFKAGSLVETSVLLETNTFGNRNTTIQQISIRIVAGVFTFSVYDNTAVVALPNTKIKTISDNNWHWAACSFDSNQGTAANQTALVIDGSVSGISSPASANLGGLEIGGELPNVGARANATSNFFTGSMRHLIANNTNDDAPTETSYFDRFTYLQTQAP